MYLYVMLKSEARGLNNCVGLGSRKVWKRWVHIIFLSGISNKRSRGVCELG